MRALPAILSAVLLLTACKSAQGTVTYVQADPVPYAEHVQPYLDVGCAALHCHGDNDRPLRIYSTLGLREDDLLRTTPVDTDHPPQPLTETEIESTVQAFSSVSPLSAGRDHFALRKPLAGDVAHVGGKLFADEDAPGYLCLLAWLAPDEAADVDLAAVCAEARDALLNP